MITGTPGITNTLAIWNPGALLTGLSSSVTPSGTSAIFRRASLNSSGVYCCPSTAIASALRSSRTPNALAMLAEVMSSWVGPMPPVVNT